MWPALGPMGKPIGFESHPPLGRAVVDAPVKCLGSATDRVGLLSLEARLLEQRLSAARSGKEGQRGQDRARVSVVFGEKAPAGALLSYEV